MPSSKFDILKRRVGAYCNVNAFDLNALKVNLEDPNNERFGKIFQQELDEVIETVALSRSAYEQLTDHEFEDDADYVAHLKSIRGFLFEGAPHP
ncbi:MAG: hypothetical protein AAF211_17825 [Myxococcota bacterium]